MCVHADVNKANAQWQWWHESWPFLFLNADGDGISNMTSKLPLTSRQAKHIWHAFKSCTSNLKSASSSPKGQKDLSQESPTNKTDCVLWIVSIFDMNVITTKDI